MAKDLPVTPSCPYRDSLRELHAAAVAARNRSWLDVSTVSRFIEAMNRAEDLLNDPTLEHPSTPS